MHQLRRLAITAENPVKLAAFYREVFELDQIGAEGGAVYLSDGIFNLALLPETGDAATGLKGVGFDTVQVESIRMKLARTANANQTLVERDSNAGIEYKIHDPDGNLIGVRARAFDVSNRHGPVPDSSYRPLHIGPAATRRFLLACLRHERSRTDGQIIDFRFRRLLELGAFVPAKEEAIGLNHFGFHVKSNEEMQIRAEKAGVRRGAARPDRIPLPSIVFMIPKATASTFHKKGGMCRSAAEDQNCPNISKPVQTAHAS